MIQHLTDETVDLIVEAVNVGIPLVPNQQNPTVESSGKLGANVAGLVIYIREGANAAFKDIRRAWLFESPCEVCLSRCTFVSHALGI